MNKNAFYPLPNEVALEILKDVINPGNPTLGVWLGWNQPESDHTVKLGDVYTGRVTVNTYWNQSRPTVKDVIREVIDSQKLDAGQAKDFIREIKAYDFKLKDKLEDVTSGIFSAEVFLPFSELEDNEKILYRLAVSHVNTSSPLHEWGIYYMESLGSQYWKNDNASVDWELYDGSSDELCQLVNVILEWNGYQFPSDLLPWVSDESEAEYYAYNDLKPDSDVLAWVNAYDNDESDTDLIEYLSGYDIRYNFEREYINCILAEIITEFKELWVNGDLTLNPGDNQPEAIKQFLESIDANPVLPGFVSGEDESE